MSLAVALAFAVGAAGSSVKFGPPSSTGHANDARRDASLLTFPGATAAKATVLCTGVINGKDTFVQSSDGGATWSAAGARVASAGGDFLLATPVPSPSGAVRGNVAGLPSGYLKDARDMVGPWTTRFVPVYSVGADGTVALDTDTSAKNATWAALPHPSALLAWQSGGVTHVSGDTYVATPWVWYNPRPMYTPAGKLNITCCNGSVVAYRTDDAGVTWRVAGTVATKASVIAAGFPSEEGPNENDVVTLKDGKTLLCVFRRDGGDGQPEHGHVPYVFATSTDLGATWTLKTAPPLLLSARPRAIVLANGALAVSGGRPALNLWVSPSGSPDGPWETFDIPSVHNTMAAPAERYCDAFCNATASMRWYQSSCYTQLGALSDDTGIVCYEKQGATSGGGHAVPPACKFEGSEIFCMRFTVTPSQ